MHIETEISTRRESIDKNEVLRQIYEFIQNIIFHSTKKLH